MHESDQCRSNRAAADTSLRSSHFCNETRARLVFQTAKCQIEVTNTSVWLCGGEWYDCVRRQTDSGRLHEDTGDCPGPEIMVAPDTEAPSNPRIAAAALESPSAAEARHSADLYIRTSWVDAALALSELEKVQCSLDIRE